jgi:hypothetical protein
MPIKNNDVSYPVHHGVVVAAQMFACMTRPEFRGPGFTWEKFPAMAGRHAEVTLWMNSYGEPTEEDNAMTRRSAADFAAVLVAEIHDEHAPNVHSGVGVHITGDEPVTVRQGTVSGRGTTGVVIG